MSGEDLRNVPVRGDIRSCSAGDTVTESYEHNQGNVQSVAEPEDTGRGGERVGEETCRCTQGVLWRERIALYLQEPVHNTLQKNCQRCLRVPFIFTRHIIPPTHPAVDLAILFTQHDHSSNWVYLSAEPSLQTPTKKTPNSPIPSPSSINLHYPSPSPPPSSPLKISCCNTILYTLAFSNVHTRLVFRSSIRNPSRTSAVGRSASEEMTLESCVDRSIDRFSQRGCRW